MNKWYGNVDLNKADAEKFRKFLKENSINYEPSDAYPLVHFEVLVDSDETETKIARFLQEEL